MSKLSKQRIKDLILNGTKNVYKTVNGVKCEWVGIGWLEIKEPKQEKKRRKR